MRLRDEKSRQKIVSACSIFFFCGFRLLFLKNQHFAVAGHPREKVWVIAWCNYRYGVPFLFQVSCQSERRAERVGIRLEMCQDDHIPRLAHMAAKSLNILHGLGINEAQKWQKMDDKTIAAGLSGGAYF